MLELLNIRFTFSLRTSHQNENQRSAIVLRIIFQKKDGTSLPDSIVRRKTGTANLAE